MVAARRSIHSLFATSGWAESGFTAIELLTVAAIVALMGAIAAPMVGQMMGSYRLGGDARGVSNSAAVAKMRAASDFTQTRLHVNLAAKTYYVEIFQKTPAPGAWVMDGTSSTLAAQDSFGFGLVATAPPNSQTVVGQAPACLNNAGAALAGTACVLFNSRGLPVDTTGSPVGTDVFYLTDGENVFGVTIAATGMIKTWGTPTTTNTTWSAQ